MSPSAEKMICETLWNGMNPVLEGFDFRQSEERMEKDKRSVEELLMEEFHRHLMAHSIEMTTGKGRPVCQFCPSLSLRPELEPGEQALLDPGQFQMPICRDLAKTLNGIYSKMLSGHLASKAFFLGLKEKLRSNPWDKPPASPGAMLSKPLAEGDTGIRATG